MKIKSIEMRAPRLCRVFVCGFVRPGKGCLVFRLQCAFCVERPVFHVGFRRACLSLHLCEFEPAVFGR